MDEKLIKKIMLKKEFSKLPRSDVLLAFEKFDKERFLDEEKVKFTRDLLRKVFSGFASQKILSLRDKSPLWILRKHLSTRERIDFYEGIYGRVLDGFGKDISVIDLGAGVNGFSYDYFRKLGYGVDYLGVESVGQLVDLMNDYFSKERINGKAVHLSIFDLNAIKKLVKGMKKQRIVFLFKVVDSLEMLKRNYSKDLIFGIAPLVDRVVISFATRSMLKKERFRVSRKWFIDFLYENFSVVDDFEIGGERYFVIENL